MKDAFRSRCNSYINSKLDRTKGCFTISLESVYSEPSIIMEIMSHMIIWEAKRDWARNVIEYIAGSYLFDSLEKGEKIPRYIIEYDRETREVTARREKNETKKERGNKTCL